MDRCERCGFVYDLDRFPEAAAQIESGAVGLADMLISGDAPTVRRRPSPETWSPLEYGCHVRDVLLVQRERVLLARRVDEPAPEPMGRDERAVHDGYDEQAPADVARQLTDAAHMLGNVLRRLSPADWERTILYNYPTPSARPLRWVAVHTWHEVSHHLQDAREGAT